MQHAKRSWRRAPTDERELDLACDSLLDGSAAAQVIFRYERSLPARYKWLAHWPPWLAVKWAFTALVLNYMAIAFLLLDLAPSLRAWAEVNFLGHILARTP